MVRYPVHIRVSRVFKAAMSQHQAPRGDATQPRKTQDADPTCKLSYRLKPSVQLSSGPFSRTHSDPQLAAPLHPTPPHPSPPPASGPRGKPPFWVTQPGSFSPWLAGERDQTQGAAQKPLPFEGGALFTGSGSSSPSQRVPAVPTWLLHSPVRGSQ